MNRNILVLALCLPFAAYAQERSEFVTSWDTVVPEKGYVLSTDLYNNKNCGKIWTKQIPEFKQKNPHIKNPDLILVHQEIMVQNCFLTEEPVVAEAAPAATKKEKSPAKDSLPFIGIYTGGSFLSEHGSDSEKVGYNLGIKAGYEFGLDEKNNLGFALGYLFNESKTSKDAGRGKYKVTTQAINLESFYLRKFTEKSRSGFLVNVLAGEDISFKEKDENSRVGVFAGGTTLYKLSRSVDLEANLQQRVDNLTRVNMLLNLGLRLNF